MGGAFPGLTYADQGTGRAPHTLFPERPALSNPQFVASRVLAPNKVLLSFYGYSICRYLLRLMRTI